NSGERRRYTDFDIPKQRDRSPARFAHALRGAGPVEGRRWRRAGAGAGQSGRAAKPAGPGDLVSERRMGLGRLRPIQEIKSRVSSMPQRPRLFDGYIGVETDGNARASAWQLAE